jgi:hypothetical protein
LSLKSEGPHFDSICASRQRGDLVVSFTVGLSSAFLTGRLVAHCNRRSRDNTSGGIKDPTEQTGAGLAVRRRDKDESQAKHGYWKCISPWGQLHLNTLPLHFWNCGVLSILQASCVRFFFSCQGGNDSKRLTEGFGAQDRSGISGMQSVAIIQKQN